MQYNILNLDVWGNETDGFAVNAAYYSGKTVDIEDDAPDTDIIASLKDICLLTDDIQPDDLEISGDFEYGIYIDDANTGEQLWQLMPQTT